MRMLQRHGIERRLTARMLSDEQIAEAAELYAAGERTSVIATKFGVDPQTIRNGFVRTRVVLKPRPATS